MLARSFAADMKARLLSERVGCGSLPAVFRKCWIIRVPAIPVGIDHATELSAPVHFIARERHAHRGFIVLLRKIGEPFVEVYYAER